MARRTLFSAATLSLAFAACGGQREPAYAPADFAPKAERAPPMIVQCQKPRFLREETRPGTPVILGSEGIAYTAQDGRKVAIGNDEKRLCTILNPVAGIDVTCHDDTTKRVMRDETREGVSLRREGELPNAVIVQGGSALYPSAARHAPAWIGLGGGMSCALHAQDRDNDSFRHAIGDTERMTVAYFKDKECSPCKAFKPALDDFMRRKGKELRLVTVDVRERQDLVDKYEVEAIPALLVFKGGRELARLEPPVQHRGRIEQLMKEARKRARAEGPAPHAPSAPRL